MGLRRVYIVTARVSQAGCSILLLDTPCVAKRRRYGVLVKHRKEVVVTFHEENDLSSCEPTTMGHKARTGHYCSGSVISVSVFQPCLACVRLDECVGQTRVENQHKNLGLSCAGSLYYVVEPATTEKETEDVDKGNVALVPSL